MRIDAYRIFASGCLESRLLEGLETNIHQVILLDVLLSNMLPRGIRVNQHDHGTPLAYQTRIRTGFHQWILVKRSVTSTVNTHQQRRNDLCRRTFTKPSIRNSYFAILNNSIKIGDATFSLYSNEGDLKCIETLHDSCTTLSRR